RLVMSALDLIRRPRLARFGPGRSSSAAASVARPCCDAESGARASPCKPSRLYLGAPGPYEPWVRISGPSLLPPILLVPAAAQAQRRRVELPKGPVGKAQSACSERVLPLVEGNKWTYGFVQSTAQPPPELAKLIPAQIGQLVISVKTIEARGTD